MTAFDSYSRNINKLSCFENEENVTETPSLEASMVYIAFHQQFINNTTCILTLALTPYPLLTTLNDIVDTMLRSRVQSSVSRGIESCSSTDISFIPSVVASVGLKSNCRSSEARLFEWCGCRENFLEYYVPTAPVHLGNFVPNSDGDRTICSGKNCKYSTNNSRKQFCDFSLLEAVSMVSVKMFACCVMELARNR